MKMKVISVIILSFLAMTQYILCVYCNDEDFAWNYQILHKRLIHKHEYGKLPKIDACTNKIQEPQDSVQSCNIRGEIYSEVVYPHLIGCYCFYWTNPSLKDPDSMISIGMCEGDHRNYTYPCIMDRESGLKVDFDYNNQKTLALLQKAFILAEATTKWVDCTKAGLHCCENMEQDAVYKISVSIERYSENFCPPIWDGWTCFSRAPANSVQHYACPYYIYSETSPSCQQYSDKTCFANGQWNQSTFYGPCSTHPIVLIADRVKFHMLMLAVSIVIAFPAIIIFFSYRKLNVTRVKLHRNLLLAIVVRNALSIASKIVISLNALEDDNQTESLIEQNSGWCKALTFFEKLAGSVVYSCMLLEGIFLHRLIAAAFRGEPNMKIYYFVAAVVAIIPVAAWTVVTAIYNNVNCWSVDIYKYYYIIDGPRIATLIVNVLLMSDTVRVLFTKLKNVNTVKSAHIRRMTRTTIFLIPLFGVQFLLTLYRPDTDDCELQQAYYYVFYTMDGLQGSIVALLYCYFNKEIQIQLLFTYTVLMTRIYSLMGKSYISGHRPTWRYSDHRQTATTLVIPEKRNQSRKIYPGTISPIASQLILQGNSHLPNNTLTDDDKTISSQIDRTYPHGNQVLGNSRRFERMLSFQEPTESKISTGLKETQDTNNYVLNTGTSTKMQEKLQVPESKDMNLTCSTSSDDRGGTSENIRKCSRSDIFSFNEADA